MSSFRVNNIWFTIISDSNVRTGKESTSESGNAFVKIPENYENITIPQTVVDPKTEKTYTVTKIGKKSFQGLNSSTYYNFDIPETVTEIDDYAFDLTRMYNFPYLPKLRRIGYLAFGTNEMRYVNITESVEEISDAAFAYGKVISIEIPPDSRLFSLDEQGALYDYKITRIIWVPRNKTFNIPLTIQSLPNHLFAYSLITEIVIPPLCSSIGYCCFVNCTNLTKITITGNIKSISGQFCTNCTDLSEIIYHGTTRIDNIKFYSDVTIYTCSEYKWEYAFGQKAKKDGNCPAMNVLLIPTCNTFIFQLIGAYAHLYTIMLC